MTRLRSRSVTALVLIVSLAACKKEGAQDGAELPAEMKPHPAQGDPSKLVMPALLANVPADTPYLVAGLDAVPSEFWSRMKQALQPVIDLAGGEWQKRRAENKVLDAILHELDGKWSQAGIESLGFSAQPRFAIYGLGLQPAVARIAVRDHAVVQATIARIAARAGEELPAMSTRDGRSYWQHTSADGTGVVIALADNQLIFAVGKAADVEARLGLILGIDKPAKSMADGALVKQLMARHGFGGQLIGFADSRQLAGKAVEAAGGVPSPACTGELDQLSARLPRVVFGYGELSAARASGALVFEMSPDLVAELRGLRAEVPGLVAAVSGQPLFALGGGVDLRKAQQLGVAMYDHLKQLGTTCQIAELVETSTRISAALARPLPDPAGQISGGAIAVDEVSFGAGKTRGPVPDRVDGLALIASPDAHALFTKLLAMAPPLQSLGITADGKLHDVAAGMVPFPVALGVGDRLIVVVAGDKRRAAGEQLLGARTGKAPLLAVGYDLGKLLDLGMQFNGAQTAEADRSALAVVRSMRGLFSRVSGAIDVTDKGLAFWSTVQMQ